MKQSFKVGHIVQDGTFVSSIDKIEGDVALLAKNYATKLEKLTPDFGNASPKVKFG